ncbi:SDR family oxidoreductase [Nitratifractor sp.]|uniref:SDR family oxidoreductase n=1 Tax=Nitratifractor sp. TaxID=2268144 RepID=UPI0025E56393|nr:SDR family oxidoreductase [Nitratifractor sp.]
MKSNGKVVLLTGASTGMGFEMMTRLAAAGYRLCVLSRSPELLRSDLLGGRWQERIDVFGVDLKERESVDKAVGETLELYGQIDVLINNAGFGLVSTLEEVEDSEMLEQFDVNLFGLVRVTRAVLPTMRRQGEGVIVNISSFLGRVGLPLLSFYNASKYAVEGITDSLRLELAPFGIRVHSVMPGFFSTQFARSNLRINAGIEQEDSPYRSLSRRLAPKVLRQINEGNDPRLVAEAILKILENPEAPVRIPVGETARRFLTMRRELNDKEYERRVMEFYGIETE